MSAQIKSIPIPPAMTASSVRADPFLMSLVAVIKEGLVRDQHVRLHQFGTFRLKWSKPSTRKHPTTGEIMHLPPQPRVYFTPAKYLRELIEPAPAPAKALVAASVTPIPVPATASATLMNANTTVAEPAKTMEATANTQQARKKSMGVPMGIGLLASVPLILTLLNAQFASETPQTPATAVATQQLTTTAVVVKDTKQSTAPSLAADVAREEVLTSQPGPQVARAADLNSASPVIKPAVPEPAVASRQVPPVSETGQKKVFMNPRIHHVDSGDNLWSLARTYFGDPHLWPYIYRANRSTLTNPNYLATGRSLVIPGLRTPATQLHEADSRLVAEGYLLLYRYYHNRASENAYKYLIGARRFDRDILQREAASIQLADLAKAR